MITDRRRSRRLPVALDAVLSHRAQAVICTLRDISLEGAFIDAASDLLPYAGTVELNFSLPTDPGGAALRLPATIRRSTDSGVAVTFGDVGREAYFGLVDLVTAPPAAILRAANDR